MTTQQHPEVVGMVELADRLEVSRNTINTWRTRGVFPEPAWIVGGRPAWTWSVVEEWAHARRN